MAKNHRQYLTPCLPLFRFFGEDSGAASTASSCTQGDKATDERDIANNERYLLPLLLFGKLAQLIRQMLHRGHVGIDWRRVSISLVFTAIQDVIRPVIGLKHSWRSAGRLCQTTTASDIDVRGEPHLASLWGGEAELVRQRLVLEEGEGIVVVAQSVQQLVQQRGVASNVLVSQSAGNTSIGN